MNKNLKNKINKLRKGEANVGLILLAFGAILAVAMYLYAKNAGSGVSSTVTGANAGVNEMNKQLGVSENGTATGADIVPSPSKTK